MHAFVEHLHAEIAAGHAAQGGGQPQLFIVAAAGIKTHHQRGLADARCQMIDVVRQVVATGFLAGFDHHHAARVRDALFLQGQDRRQRAEHRIAVVRAAAAV